MRALFTRIAILLVSLAVAAAGITISFVFFCVALYEAFLNMLSPALAALASAGVVLFVTLLIVVIANAVGRALTRRRLSNDPVAAGRALGAMFAREFQSLSARSRGASLLMSLLAGLVSGAKPPRGA